MDLLLHPEERTAVRDGARAHLDGYPDERVPEAEALGPPQSDAVPWGLSAWDAWDGVHRDEEGDAAHLHPVVPGDADAERSVGPARGGLALDAWFPQARRRERLEVARLDAAAPYTPDAVPSVERSSAAQGFVEWAVPLVLLDAGRSERLVARARRPKP